MVCYYHVNTNLNEAGVVVITANKIEFKVGSIARNKEGHSEKRIHSGGSVAILNL